VLIGRISLFGNFVCRLVERVQPIQDLCNQHQSNELVKYLVERWRRENRENQSDRPRHLTKPAADETKQHGVAGFSGTADEESVPRRDARTREQPSDQQRASLLALASTTLHVSALLQSSCPSATLVTPTGRLEAVASRLDSMIDAVTLERTALNDFYASLNDGQKARFGAEIRQPQRARDNRAPP
jgi:LTXXQ motif family protein